MKQNQMNNLADLNDLPESEQKMRIIEDFTLYAKFILGESFKFKKHHYLACAEINKSILLMKEGKRTRKGFFEPPRHGKTLFFADLLFSYFFGRFPDKRCLYGTYNEDLAATRKTTIENIISSEEYQWLFPEAKTRDMLDDLKDVPKSIRKTLKNTSHQINNVNSRSGALIFVGRGSSTTGKGFDLIVIDDPYKDPREARSEKINLYIKDWFKWVIQTRIEPGCQMFLIYTRWVTDDIAGMLEKNAIENNDPHYVPLQSFILRAEKRDEILEYDDREEGEPLDDDRLAEYADAKKDPDVWAAMYQQEPLDAFGALFKLAWFPRHYNNGGMQYITIVVDANFREHTKSKDKTAVSVFGTKFGKRHLIEFVLKKMDYLEQLAVISHFAKKYSYWAILVETKANGDALLSSLRTKFPRCVGVDPHGKGKRERAQLVLPFVQAGYLSLPDITICSNVTDAISQILTFTGIGDEEDDFIDTLIYDIAYYEQYANVQTQQVIGVVTDKVAKKYIRPMNVPIARAAGATNKRMRNVR